MWVLTGGARANVRRVDYPHVRMAAGAHDRIAVRRRDDAWLEERWADPDTRVLVVSGTRVQPRDGADPLGDVRSEAPDGLRVLLGEQDGRAWFAVDHRTRRWPRRRRTSGSRCAGCCRTWPTTTWPSAPLVFHALGLAEWLFVTRFCPRCGGRLRAAGGRPRAGVRRLRHGRSSRAPTRR